MNSDLELLNASLHGDKQSFGDIVNRYKSVICAITYNATGDVTLSEDIAQETFIAAWKNLRNLRDKTKFKSWLYGIARNISSNYIRKKYKDVTHNSVPLDEKMVNTIEQSTPRDLAITKEEENLLWRTLEEIPETYREPLILYYRENQSIKSVADVLDLSEDAVKQRLSRGRNMLRIQMAEFVENTLRKTGPKENFAIGVLAVLPALAPPTAAGGLLVTAGKSSTAVGSAFTLSSTAAVLGPILGALGGIIGSIASIVNTKSKRERRLMTKFVILILGVVTIFLGVITYLIPKLPNHRLEIYAISMTIYIVILVGLVIWVNRRQKAIQIEDGTYQDKNLFQKIPTQLSKGAVYGSLGGVLFGGLCWIIPMSVIVNDYATMTLTLMIAILSYIYTSQRCLKKPGQYWGVVKWSVLGVGLINLVVINLRWNDWMVLYRESTFYDRSSDLSLWTMNLMVISIVLFAIGMISFIVAKRNTSA